MLCISLCRTNSIIKFFVGISGISSRTRDRQIYSTFPDFNQVQIFYIFYIERGLVQYPVAEFKEFELQYSIIQVQVSVGVQCST